MTSIFEVAYNSLQFVKCISDSNLIRDLEDDVAKRTAT